MAHKKVTKDPLRVGICVMCQSKGNELMLTDMCKGE